MYGYIIDSDFSTGKDQSFGWESNFRIKKPVVEKSFDWLLDYSMFLLVMAVLRNRPNALPEQSVRTRKKPQPSAYIVKYELKWRDSPALALARSLKFLKSLK